MRLFGPPNIQKLKAKGNMKGLIKALGYRKDASVSQAAAVALGTLDWEPDKDEVGTLYWIKRRRWDKCVEIGELAVIPLIVTLKDEESNEEVRQGAVEVLGQIGDSRAVKPLIAALKDENKDVRTNAAKALGQIGDVQAVQPLIITLKDAYRSGDAALEALVKIGSHAIEPLIAALKDESTSTRQRAAEALGQIGDARAAVPLIVPLKDDSGYVQNTATKALLKIGSPAAVKSFCVVLKDENEDVRINAAKALGQIGDVRAVEPLVDVLGAEKDQRAREAVAEALIQIGDRRAIEPLAEMLRKEEPGRREWWIEVVGSLIDTIRKESDWAKVVGLYWIFKEEWDRCIELGTAAIPLLEICVKANEASGYVRECAARVLGQVGDACGIKLLIALLGNRDWRVCAAALYGLREAGWDRCVEFGTTAIPLLETLVKANETPTDVRDGAAQALGQVGDACGIELLVALLRNRDWRVRAAALHGLRKVGWEPDEDMERAACWIVSGDVNLLAGLDCQAIKQLLVDSMEWAMAPNSWYVRGRIAELLTRPEIGADSSIIAQAANELELFAKGYSDALDGVVKNNSSEKDSKKIKAMFGDYAILLISATDGNLVTSESAVKELCQIKTPVSTNLLHHLGKLADVKISRVFEVEYDVDHPSGMGSSTTTFSFKSVRDIAKAELARRGNPKYDFSIYKTDQCWKNEVLAKLRDPLGIPALIRNLENDDYFKVVVPAQKALLQYGIDTILEDLLEVLQNPRGFLSIIHVAQIFGMSKYNNINVTPYLIEGLKSRKNITLGRFSHFDSNLLSVLKKITGEDFGVRIAKWEAWWKANKSRGG